MSEDREEFLARLHMTFCREVFAHVASIGSLLDRIEAVPVADDRGPLLHQLLREVHSLKGAAGAVNENELEYLSRELERVLARLQRNDMQVSEAFFAMFRQSMALIERMARADRTLNATVIPVGLLENIHRFADGVPK